MAFKPVFQETTDDCLSAAWASILGIPLKRVPNFFDAAFLLTEDEDEDSEDFLTAYWDIHSAWLKSVNIHVVTDIFSANEWGLAEALEFLVRDDPFPLYRVGLLGSVGHTEQGHAVVLRGKQIIHDPGAKTSCEYAPEGITLIGGPNPEGKFKFLLPVRIGGLIGEAG